VTPAYYRVVPQLLAGGPLRCHVAVKRAEKINGSHIFIFCDTAGFMTNKET
jgi:hypothetical protein